MVLIYGIKTVTLHTMKKIALLLLNAVCSFVVYGQYMEVKPIDSYLDSENAAIDAKQAVTPGSYTIKDAFVGMPDSMIPAMDVGLRKDLIDLYESGMKTSLENDWGGSARVVDLRDDYMRFYEDGDSIVRTEMALLRRADKGVLICVVRTLHVPEPFSSMQVFTTEWEERNLRKLIRVPELDEMPVTDVGLAQGSGLSGSGIVPARFMHISVEPQGEGRPVLRFSSNLSDSYILYRWNGKKFKPLTIEH